MTKEEVLLKLRTDPRFLIQTIVFNNPYEVSHQLAALTDMQTDSIDYMIDSIYELLDAGEIDAVNQIIQVPFLSENAIDPLIEAHEQMVNDRGNTTTGRFLDSNQGLFVLATSTGAGKNANKGSKSLNILNPTNCGKNIFNKCLTLKVKHIIVGVLILGIIIYFLKRTKVINIK